MSLLLGRSLRAPRPAEHPSSTTTSGNSGSGPSLIARGCLGLTFSSLPSLQMPEIALSVLGPRGCAWLGWRAQSWSSRVSLGAAQGWASPVPCGRAHRPDAPAETLELRWGQGGHLPAIQQPISCSHVQAMEARKFPEFLWHEVSQWPSWDTTPGALGRVLWALSQDFPKSHGRPKISRASSGRARPCRRRQSVPWTPTVCQALNLTLDLLALSLLIC